jgi:hypothetical protein
MPRTVKGRKPRPDLMYVAWDSASIGSLPETPVVRKGTRLRGDNELVCAAPWLFVEDRGDERETARAIRQRQTAELFDDSNAPPPAPPPLREEEALVAIQDVGGLEIPVVAGQRVALDHSAVKHNRGAFVEVVPPGLSRDDALVARTTMRMRLDDGPERVPPGRSVGAQGRSVRRAASPSLPLIGAQS